MLDLDSSLLFEPCLQAELTTKLPVRHSILKVSVAGLSKVRVLDKRPGLGRFYIELPPPNRLSKANLISARKNVSSALASKERFFPRKIQLNLSFVHHDFSFLLFLPLGKPNSLRYDCKLCITNWYVLRLFLLLLHFQSYNDELCCRPYHTYLW